MDPRDRVAISSPQHLKAWLNASGRSFIIFKADDLIDALPWPAGVESFMQLVREYDLRRTQIANGQTEVMITANGERVVVEVTKDQLLEEDEIDECISQLQTEREQRRAKASERAATHKQT